MWAWLAGAFFAADLLLWHHSIEHVGAGLATVLGNTQVVLVGVLAWLLYRERPSLALLAAIPVAMGGIVLISGVFEEGAYGDDPLLGVLFGVLTGVAYTGYSRSATARAISAAWRARSTTPPWRRRS